MLDKYLVVNDIRVSDNEIFVGCTDNMRWKWEIDEGTSGADAMGIAFVTLEISATSHVLENLNIDCPRQDELRPIVMKQIESLFDIAWDIYDKKLSGNEAKETYFGHKIG